MARGPGRVSRANCLVHGCTRKAFDPARYQGLCRPHFNEDREASALVHSNAALAPPLPEVSQDADWSTAPSPAPAPAPPPPLPPAPPPADAEDTASSPAQPRAKKPRKAGPPSHGSDSDDEELPEAPKFFLQTSSKADSIIDSSKHVAIWWSLTIASSQKNFDVPLSWFTAVKELFPGISERSAFALERGDKKSNLHIQGMALLHTAGKDDAAARKLRTAIRKELGFTQAHLQFKAFKGGQNFFEMLGYLTKDKGKPHYRLVLNNIGQDVAERAANQRQISQPMAWADGYIIVHKSNVFNVLYGQYVKHLYPLHMHMVTVAYFFVGPGHELMWDANSMAGSAQGRPFDFTRAEAMWALRIMLEPTSPGEMWQLSFKILYYDRFTKEAMEKLMEEESRWLQLSLDEVKTFAHNVKLVMDGLARGKVCLGPGETAATLSAERAQAMADGLAMPEEPAPLVNGTASVREASGSHETDDEEPYNGTVKTDDDAWTVRSMISEHDDVLNAEDDPDTELDGTEWNGATFSPCGEDEESTE
ncbi:unnamed protein product [Chrysoparadoxa australica]